MILAAILVPFLAAPLVAMLARPLGRLVGWVAALALVPALLLATRGPGAAAGAVWREAWPWVPQLGLGLEFRLDGFSLLFAVMIALVGVASSVYSVAYLGRREHHGRFYAHLLLFAGSMLGLVLAENLILLFAFWEMTSVSSFLLIGHWHERPAARDGAIKALLVTGLGGLALLAASALVLLGGGSANLSTLDAEAFRASPYFLPALLLVLLAAFTKSAQLPFHIWLPTAMEAPTPVSAFLHSATMVKAGVYLIARLGGLFEGPVWSVLAVSFGLATLGWGSYLALRQTDLKALLAYSTVSQLGLLVALYGLNEPAARFAATVHLLNHAAFKATLFFVVGIVDHQTGTRDLRVLGGLRRLMPVSFALSLLAALSMAGVPPLGGFVSKELFYDEMLGAGPLLAAVAVAGSVFTFAYSLRFLGAFLGPLRAPDPGRVHEAPAGLLGPFLALALAVPVFGLLPGTAEALARVAGPALGFAGLGGKLALWHGLNVVLGLSVLTWLLGTLALVVRSRIELGTGRARRRPSADAAYHGLVAGLERLAVGFTRATQGQGMPDQLRLMLVVIVGLVGYGLVRANVGVPAEPGAVPLTMYPIALLLAAGALGVLAARDGITAVVFTGLTGFGTAAAFLVLRAPDLALTQLLIESTTVILFLLAFRFLPPMRLLSRTPGRRLLDAGLGAAVGTGLFTFLMATTRPLAPSISGYYLENSLELGGGKNVVNVILVDFRGYDTLGEITVLAIVGVAVYALMRLRGAR